MESTEETVFEKNESKNQNSPSSKTHNVRDTAAGIVSGIIIGSAGTLAFSSAMAAEPAPQPTPEPSPNPNPNPAPINTGGIETVLMSSNVTDEMSFSEAFSTARAEVGPGGAFTWHGNVYSTFTAEEWNELTEFQRQEYYDHFSEITGTETGGGGKDDIISGDDVVVVDGGPELEIYGVVHDEETGANIGGMSVNGQEVLLVDVDGVDDRFDLMASDLNHDGVITENEITDITGQSISVSGFANLFTDSSEIYASNDHGLDYVNDADVHEFMA